LSEYADRIQSKRSKLRGDRKGEATWGIQRRASFSRERKRALVGECSARDSLNKNSIKGKRKRCRDELEEITARGGESGDRKRPEWEFKKKRIKNDRRKGKDRNFFVPFQGNRETLSEMEKTG